MINIQKMYGLKFALDERAFWLNMQKSHKNFCAFYVLNNLFSVGLSEYIKARENTLRHYDITDENDPKDFALAYRGDGLGEFLDFYGTFEKAKHKSLRKLCKNDLTAVVSEPGHLFCVKNGIIYCSSLINSRLLSAGFNFLLRDQLEIYILKNFNQRTG